VATSPGKIDNDVIRAALSANDRLIQASSGFSEQSAWRDPVERRLQNDAGRLRGGERGGD